MKEERMAILRMLENGIVSAEEAERLLNVLYENSGKDASDGIESSFAKAGSTLESIVENVGKKAGLFAKVVGEKAEQARPEIKKAAKTVADKISEAAETIKDDINKKKAEKNGVYESDFVYNGQAEEKTEESDDAKPEGIVTNPTEENTASVSGIADNAQPEEVYTTEENTETNKQENDDDDRDYEAEFYQMMRETNGGDIFGDVYKAMDNLRGIDSDAGEASDNAENNKTDKE